MKTLFFTLLFLFCAISSYAQAPFWVQTNGPSGEWGQMVFPSNGDIFVLNLTILFHSTDAGSTWKTKKLDFVSTYPMNGGHQLAISSKDFLFILHGDTLYRSKDNGDNWQKVLKGSFWNPSFLLSSTGFIFLYSEANGNPSSLWRSSDEGDTWTDIISHSPLLANSIEFMRGSVTPSGELIFIQQDSSYFSYSNDNGETWGQQSILPFKFNGAFPVQGMKNGYLFCAGQFWIMNNKHSATIRSTDNGKTWDSVTTSMNLIFASDDVIGNVIQNDLFQYSTDYGNTWQKTFFPSSGLAGRGFPDSKGNIYWSSSERAIRYNTITKITEELQIPIGQVYHVFVEHKGTLISDGMNFFSTSANRGKEWSTSLACNDSVYCWSLPDIAEDSSGGIISLVASSFFRTTDLGNTWTMTSAPHTNRDQFNGVGYNRGHMILTTPNGNIFSCASDSGLIRSTDLGNSWEPLTNGLHNVYSNAIDCDKSGVLYTFWSHSIYRSTTNGDSWEEMININHPLFFNNNDSTSEIQCIVATPRGEIFAGTSHNGLMVSDDQGLSWRNANKQADSVYPHSLFASPNGDVFAISSTGKISFHPYKSTAWNIADSGLTFSNDVQSMAFAPDGTAYLGTNGRGVWRSQGAVNAVHSTSITSDKITLSISPNPASSNARITYSLRERGFVKLDLCDALGRTFLTFVNQIQDAGEHSVNAELPNLTNGIYFVKLTTPMSSVTKKIIVAK